MKVEKDLKEAIFNMPQKEKDKLLLRLIRKDDKLIERLEFELISTDTVELRRQKVQDEILKLMKDKKNSDYASNLTHLKSCFSQIKHHLDITRDKHGEILLHVILIANVSSLNYTNYSFWRGNSRLEAFANYLIDKMFKMLLLIQDVHEDYLVDFEDYLSEIHTNITADPRFFKLCIRKGFDVNWLKDLDLPEDLKARATEARRLKL